MIDFLNGIKFVTGPLTLVAFLAVIVLALFWHYANKRGLEYVYNLFSDKLTRDNFYNLSVLIISRAFWFGVIVVVLAFIGYVIPIVSNGGVPPSPPPDQTVGVTVAKPTVGVSGEITTTGNNATIGLKEFSTSDPTGIADWIIESIEGEFDKINDDTLSFDMNSETDRKSAVIVNWFYMLEQDLIKKRIVSSGNTVKESDLPSHFFVAYPRHRPVYVTWSGMEFQPSVAVLEEIDSMPVVLSCQDDSLRRKLKIELTNRNCDVHQSERLDQLKNSIEGLGQSEDANEKFSRIAESYAYAVVTIE